MMLTIHNPARATPKKKRAKKRTTKEKSKMAKHKRSKKRKNHARKKRRKNPTSRAASPVRRRRRRSNPKRSHPVHARARRRNPAPRIRRRKRRKNPEMGKALEQVGKGALAGVLAGTAVIAGAGIASAISANAAKYGMIGLGVAGLVTGAALYGKHPEIGAGIAGGSVAAVALPITGALASAKLTQLFNKPAAQPAPAQPTTKGVTFNDMGAQRYLAGKRLLAGVTFDDMGNPYGLGLYDQVDAHMRGGNPYGQ